MIKTRHKDAVLVEVGNESNPGQVVHAGIAGRLRRQEIATRYLTLIKIAYTLGVTVDYLLMDVSEVKPNSLVDELTTLAKGGSRKK
ncbi:MAG: hypothetical protein M1609_17775 [Firmicutes bacterium]|nr:hypothetical protein [Bacillota bacterium]